MFTFGFWGIVVQMFVWEAEEVPSLPSASAERPTLPLGMWVPWWVVVQVVLQW